MSSVNLLEDSYSPAPDLRRVAEPRMEVHYFVPGAVVGTCFLALLLQAFLPVYVRKADLLELPLLVTLYFGLSRRNPSRGLLLGMVIGMAQDGLSGAPVGLFGIAKTLVGYLASTIGARLDVEHPYSRLFLTFVAFQFHHIVHALSRRWLLNEHEALFSSTLLLASVVNALLAVGLFHLLDRLRDTER